MRPRIEQAATRFSPSSRGGVTGLPTLVSMELASRRRSPRLLAGLALFLGLFVVHHAGGTHPSGAGMATGAGTRTAVIPAPAQASAASLDAGSRSPRAPDRHPAVAATLGLCIAVLVSLVLAGLGLARRCRALDPGGHPGVRRARSPAPAPSLLAGRSFLLGVQRC